MYQIGRTTTHTSFTSYVLRESSASMDRGNKYNSGVPPSKYLVGNGYEWIF